MHHRVLRVCVGLDVARGGAAVGHRAPQCWQGEAEGTAQVKKLGGSSRQEKENQKNTVGKKKVLTGNLWCHLEKASP